jgi:hypothetical protein
MPFISRGFLCWNYNPLYQFINKKLFIDRASRTDINNFFNPNFNMVDYEMNETNNWIEEFVVTF